jgi:hypothetical protein
MRVINGHATQLKERWRRAAAGRGKEYSPETRGEKKKKKKKSQRAEMFDILPC